MTRGYNVRVMNIADDHKPFSHRARPLTSRLSRCSNSGRRRPDRRCLHAGVAAHERVHSGGPLTCGVSAWSGAHKADHVALCPILRPRRTWPRWWRSYGRRWAGCVRPTRGCVRSLSAKDELLAGKEGLLANQDGLIDAQREQLGNYADTVRLHADRAQVQDQLVDSQGELIDRLTAENAELRRRLSMDSSNSSCRRARIRPRPRPSGERRCRNGNGPRLANPAARPGARARGWSPPTSTRSNGSNRRSARRAGSRWTRPHPMRGSPRCKCGTSQFDLVRRRCPAGHLTQAQPVTATTLPGRRSPTSPPATMKLTAQT
jgi:hypothetical protein